MDDKLQVVVDQTNPFFFKFHVDWVNFLPWRVYSFKTFNVKAKWAICKWHLPLRDWRTKTDFIYRQLQKGRYINHFLILLNFDSWDFNPFKYGSQTVIRIFNKMIYRATYAFKQYQFLHFILFYTKILNIKILMYFGTLNVW